jgi:hypothetical protein
MKDPLLLTWGSLFIGQNAAVIGGIGMAGSKTKPPYSRSPVLNWDPTACGGKLRHEVHDDVGFLFNPCRDFIRNATYQTLIVGLSIVDQNPVFLTCDD